MINTSFFNKKVTTGKDIKVFQFNVAEDERVYPLPIIYIDDLDLEHSDQAKEFLTKKYINQNASADLILNAFIEHSSLFNNDLFNILLLSVDAVEHCETDFGMICPNTEDRDENLFLGLNQSDPIEVLSNGSVRFIAHITNGYCNAYAVVEVMPVNLCPNPFPVPK